MLEEMQPLAVPRSFTHVTWGPTCAKVVSVLQKLLNIETHKDTIAYIYMYTHVYEHTAEPWRLSFQHCVRRFVLAPYL